MAKKTKTTKKLASKKTRTKKPVQTPITDKDAKEFWTKFENDLYTNPIKTEKKFPLDYHNVQFQGYFKNLGKDSTKKFDSIDLFADDRPWFVKAWGKVIEAYRSATDYAWENPVKTFFIIVGAVFTMSVVSSCVQKYL